MKKDFRNTLTAYERETIVNFNDGGKEMEIYTCSKRIMNKLDKLCKGFPEMYSLKREDGDSKTYICRDKKYLRFSRPRKVKTGVSAEKEN